MHVTCTFQGRRKTSSPQKNQNRNQTGLGRNEADSITSLPPTDWKSSTCSKGAFYFEGDSLISHQYNLELQQRQRVQISIQVRIQSMDLVLVKQLGASLSHMSDACARTCGSHSTLLMFRSFSLPEEKNIPVSACPSK